MSMYIYTLKTAAHLFHRHEQKMNNNKNNWKQNIHKVEHIML